MTDGENFLDGRVDAFPCCTSRLETLDSLPAVVTGLLLGFYLKPFIDWAVAATLMFSNSAVSQLVLQASSFTDKPGFLTRLSQSSSVKDFPLYF